MNAESVGCMAGSERYQGYRFYTGMVESMEKTEYLLSESNKKR